jgi:large conductance mechanosensitive channel
LRPPGQSSIAEVTRLDYGNGPGDRRAAAARERAMSFVGEFKDFAMRGNVVDLAVGVVIGAAFGKIVSSLVDSIIMPIVGVLTGGINFSNLAVQIATTPKGDPVLLKYGAFIQSVVDFLIVAFVIFIAIRFVNRLHKPAPAAAAAPPPPPRSEVLLEEIRDLLKDRR